MFFAKATTVQMMSIIESEIIWSKNSSVQVKLTIESINFETSFITVIAWEVTFCLKISRQSLNPGKQILRLYENLALWA